VFPSDVKRFLDDRNVGTVVAPVSVAAGARAGRGIPKVEAPAGAGGGGTTVASAVVPFERGQHAPRFVGRDPVGASERTFVLDDGSEHDQKHDEHDDLENEYHAHHYQGGNDVRIQG
jgi:hypothetical protein